MLNAFDVLAKDHQEVKQMLAELERWPFAATGAGPDELALLRKMVQQLVIERSQAPGGRGDVLLARSPQAPDRGENLANQAQDQDRAHPAAPAHPRLAGLLKTAGPAVAGADRLRDAATGRDEQRITPPGHAGA